MNQLQRVREEIQILEHRLRDLRDIERHLMLAEQIRLQHQLPQDDYEIKSDEYDTPFGRIDPNTRLAHLGIGLDQNLQNRFNPRSKKSPKRNKRSKKVKKSLRRRR